MSNITYKQAMSHNRKLDRQIENGQIDFDDWKKKTICLHSLIRRELVSDEGLPAQLKAGFHSFNENGIVSQMGNLRWSEPCLKAYAEMITELCWNNRAPAWKVRRYVDSAKKELLNLKEVA